MSETMDRYTASYDGVIKQEFELEDGVMHAITTQPTEDIILNRNAELRKNPGVIKDLEVDGETFGRLLCTIPEIMFTKAIKDGYQLRCPDADIRSKELNRFLRSPEGKLCLVQA